MASEYLLKKYADVKPDEERVLTPEEKRRNWWFYHKWHVVIGAVLVLCLCNILWHALGIGEVEPDFTIAYVGSQRLSEGAAEALTQGLEALAPDMNGDGKISVALVQYYSPDTGDSDALYYAQAAQVQLVADITDCRSFFFLMDDPEKFQQATGALCRFDGAMDETGKAEGKYVLWGDCPALMEIDSSLSELAFGRRGFWGERRAANAEACAELWQMLIAK